MATIREVRKRDNRVVPFNALKITDAIYKAIRSVGKGDRALAEELSGAVVHFLEERFSGRIPGIEDIQDHVETVLIETGHAEIAKAYILYRNKRTLLRETLQVRRNTEEPSRNAPAGAQFSPPWVEEEKQGVSRWAKSRITAALIREADMDPATAEEIASAVERKVFSSEIQHINTSLIRELVDNELFERGFNAKLQRQAPLGLPKYNLEQILFGLDSKEGYCFPKTPVEVHEFIASHILRQYALREVYSPAVAEAHRDGRIHLHQLEDPIRLAEATWNLPFPLTAVESSPREGASPGEAGVPGGRLGAWPELSNESASRDGFLDLGDLWRRLLHLGQFVHGQIRLCGLERLLADRILNRSLGRARPEEKIQDILGRLREIRGGLPRTPLALEMGLAPSSRPWLEAILSRDGFRSSFQHIFLKITPQEVLEERCRPVLELAAELYARGSPVEFLPVADRQAPRAGRSAVEPLRGAGGRRTAGGELLRRRPRLMGLASRVSINLPRAAFRSARGRSGNVAEQLEEVTDLAIKGLLERRQFLARLGHNGENPLWDVLGRPQNVDGTPLFSTEELQSSIGLAGLNECVKFLTGHEFHQDDRAVHKGQEIVRVIRRKIKREERGLGLLLDLEETPLSPCLRRFEDSDRVACPQLEEIDRGRSPGTPTYTPGVRIHAGAAVDPLRRLEHLVHFLPDVVPRRLLEDSPELCKAQSSLLVCLFEEFAPALGEALNAGASQKGRASVKST